MADPRLFRLRVTFRETGRLAMLSHLELARAPKAMRMCGEKPWLTAKGSCARRTARSRARASSRCDSMARRPVSRKVTRRRNKRGSAIIESPPYR